MAPVEEVCFMEPIMRRNSAVTVPLDTHNILDYVAGAALIFSPYVFGFSAVNMARNIFLLLGFGLIAYSLCTDYRYSVFKLIPVKTHMILDVIAGAILILSPMVMGYSSLLTGFQNALHYIFGIGVIVLVALTKPKATRAITATVEEEEPRDFGQRAA